VGKILSVSNNILAHNIPISQKKLVKNAETQSEDIDGVLYPPKTKSAHVYSYMRFVNVSSDGLESADNISSSPANPADTLPGANPSGGESSLTSPKVLFSNSQVLTTASLPQGSLPSSLNPPYLNSSATSPSSSVLMNSSGNLTKTFNSTVGSLSSSTLEKVAKDLPFFLIILIFSDNNLVGFNFLFSCLNTILFYFILFYFILSIFD
jgi:hypothetical protein